MRFALLGEDPLLMSLASAARRLGHTLAWAGELGDAPADDLARLAISDEDTPWERLLDGDLVDAVFVGRGADEDRRADQIRKLVQAEIPLLVVHPVCMSMLTYFEIDMVRDESQSLVQHYTPGACHPALAELKRLTESDDDHETIEQVVLDRALSSRGRDDVFSQFVRDVEVINHVAGDVNRVATLKADEVTDAYSSLSVQMSTTRNIVVRWSVGPATNALQGARLTVVRQSGQTVLQMPDDIAAWRLERSGGGEAIAAASALEDRNDWDDAAEQVQRFSAALQSRNSESTWPSAARSVEVADALERSMKKGRTIELHFEQFSEESTFRGLMTSLGCGLLIAGLFVALIAGLVGDAFDIGPAHGWYYLVLAVFVLFLLVQLIPRLIIDRDAAQKDTEQADGEPRDR